MTKALQLTAFALGGLASVAIMLAAAIGAFTPSGVATEIAMFSIGFLGFWICFAGAIIKERES